jgi:hypothetical protein
MAESVPQIIYLLGLLAERLNKRNSVNGSKTVSLRPVPRR